MKKTFLCALALLLLLAACAPPKEKFNPDATAVDSPDYKSFTVVPLDDSAYEKQAQILAVRLSDFVNRRDEISTFVQFYEGLCRYALVCLEPTGQRDSQWVLFCYETGKTEPVIQNARLLEIASKDDISFLRSGYFPDEELYRFPETVRILRSGTETLSLRSDAWLPLSYETVIGPVNRYGSPKTFSVLQLMENLHINETGLQLTFRRYAATAIENPPHCSIETDAGNKTVTLTYTGANIGPAVSREFTGSAVGCFAQGSVRQSGNKVVITLTLNTADVAYNYTQGDTLTVGSDLYNIIDLRFCAATGAAVTLQ